MRVSDVLRVKGTQVQTVSPTDTVSDVVELLREHRIGALVVTDDESRVVGVVSERDVVNHLSQNLMSMPVSDIMSVDVYTCGPDQDLESLAREMTAGRFRHVPVVVDGQLSAIVSIGDVVKYRIDQLTAERDALEGYVHQ